MNAVVAQQHAGPPEQGERKLRQQVAACTLMLNDLGLLGYSGHVSARLPSGDALLIQSRDHPRASLGPDDLLVCGLDGKMRSGSPGVRPPSEIYLHTEIMQARPDINAVAHFHHDRTTTFTMIEGGTIKLIKNHAIRWTTGIPVHPEPGHVNTPGRGQALARTLGPAHALQIRAHGQVICAESVPGVLIDSVNFIENAEAMILASQLGRVLPLTPAEIADFQASLTRDHFVGKAWGYYVTVARKHGVLPEGWEI